MRKAFTMIELIFVIVILGVLAAIAMPRLAATRDDAAIARAATDFNTIIQDVAAYRISQNSFAKNITDMTNVSPCDSQSHDQFCVFAVKGKKCFLISSHSGGGGCRPDYIAISKYAHSSSEICKKLLAIPSVKELVGKKFKDSCKHGSESGYEITGIPIGANVVW